MVSNPDVAALIVGSGGTDDPPSDHHNDWFWHVVYRVGFLLAIIGVVVGSIATATAYIEQAATSAQSKCINRILADRNGTSAADEAAHARAAQADADWSEALTMLLTFPATAAPAEKQAEVAAFISAQRVYSAAMDEYSSALAANQAYRAAHPLGSC